MKRGALTGFAGAVRGRLGRKKPNRAQLGLIAVVFVLVVGAMEILALKVGSFNLPLPSDSHPAVADHPQH